MGAFLRERVSAVRSVSKSATSSRMRPVDISTITPDTLDLINAFVLQYVKVNSDHDIGTGIGTETKVPIEETKQGPHGWGGIRPHVESSS